jgi:hypothetical protein
MSSQVPFILTLVGAVIFTALYSIPFLIAAVLLWLVFRGIASLGIMDEISGKRSRTRNPPECAVCGFDVRGLHEFRCPECGSNLLVVGIIGSAERRTGRRGPRSLIARLIVWTIYYGAVLFFGSLWYWGRVVFTAPPILLLALVLVGWLCGVFVTARSHRRHQERLQLVAVPMPPLNPASKATPETEAPQAFQEMFGPRQTD